MFRRLGPWEMILVAGACLLFFGNRLPSAMQSLADQFRNGRGGGPRLGV